jgi:glyoxylase-like metal-dependent hydrolase (beta-lactamase superfamily II)
MVQGNDPAAAAAAVATSAASTWSLGSDAGIKIHRFDQRSPFPVNAFIVEDAAGLVVIDATLTNSASNALRAKVDQLAKPLRAVMLTHPHPDHYAGLGNLVAGLDVPIVSVAGVNDVARRDDALKNEVIGGMFGAEWPRHRVFPNQTVKDGDILAFGAMRFEVRDIGPSESHHDSMFVMQGSRQESRPRAFAGDIAYGLMHAFMADNQNPAWRRAIERVQSDLAEDTVLHIGHGPAVTPGFLRWQSTYLDRFENALRKADWSDARAAQASVSNAMRDYLPSDDLLFLMQISIQPNAERLGLTKDAGRHGS